jgi:hypothetical protein
MTVSFRCDRERLQRFKGEESKGRCPSTRTRLCDGTPSFEMVIFREVGKQQEKGHLRLTLQRQNIENSNQIFPEMKPRGLSPKSYIHVNVCDLYIPSIGLQENRWTDRGNI